MFLKIIRWSSISLLVCLGWLIVLAALWQARQKTVAPMQTPQLIAEQKLRKGAKCTPATNKNCFTITPDQLVKIQKMRDGLSRKNN